MKFFYNNIRKIICFLILISSSLPGIFMIGCAHNYEFRDWFGDYSVEYEDVSYDWSAEHSDFVGLSNSLDELKSLCKKNNYTIFSKGTTDYETNFGKKIREYTNGYFKKSSLLICAVTESNYLGTLKVESLEVNENKLTLKIKRQKTDCVEDIMCSWGFVVEVDTSFVSSVKDYKYVIY